MENQVPSDVAQKKLIARILGILLGSLGIHKFVLGYHVEGIIMLLVSLLTCGLAGTVMGIVRLIEGIIYLATPDDRFYETYIMNKKGWF